MRRVLFFVGLTVGIGVLAALAWYIKDAISFDPQLKVVDDHLPVAYPFQRVLQGVIDSATGEGVPADGFVVELDGGATVEELAQVFATGL